MSTVGTPRYQLAKDIFMADNSDAPSPEREWDIATTKEHAYAYAIADGLIAAGWTKPRTIEDVESRDALPDGTVVRSSAGTIACRFDNGRGVMFGMSLPFPWKNLALPLTVLWEPTP